MPKMLAPGYDPITTLTEPGAVLVIGRPATGKTRHVVEVATRLAAAGREVLFLSLETDAEELAARGLAGVAVDPRGGRSLEDVVALIGSMPASAVLVVDYLQLLYLPGLDAVRTPNAVGVLHEVGTAAGVTVIVASQLNRKFDSADSLATLPEWVGRVPRVVLLRQAGALETPAPSNLKETA